MTTGLPRAETLTAPHAHAAVLVDSCTTYLRRLTPGFGGGTPAPRGEPFINHRRPNEMLDDHADGLACVLTSTEPLWKWTSTSLRRSSLHSIRQGS